MESEEDSLIIFFNHHLSQGTSYNEGDILLDTGSTVSVFKDSKMLTDIHETKQTMRALTNGGYQDSTKKGILPGFFPVWYNQDSRIHILSWKDVRGKFRITADTDKGNVIVVHLGDGKTMVFEEVDSGLYLYRMNKAAKNDHSENRVSSYSFLTLVAANRYQHLGMPGYRRIFKALERNYIKNCPVTLDDAKRALHIYGPDAAHMQGKATRGKAAVIPTRNQPSAYPGQSHKNTKVRKLVRGLFLHTRCTSVAHHFAQFSI